MFEKYGIYFLLIFVVIIGNILTTLFIKRERLQKIIYGLIVFFCFFFVISCRDISVGNDTFDYYNIYQDMHVKTLNGIEIGYAILMKITIFFKISFRGFLFVITFITLAPLFWFFYRNSKNLCLSFIIFTCFYFFSFSLSAIRNSAAISIVLLSYESLKIKKIWLRLFCVFLFVGLASSIHLSAVITLPLFLFFSSKLRLKHLLYLILICALALIYRTQIYEFINQNIYRLGNTPPILIGGRIILLTIIFVVCSIAILPSDIKVLRVNKIIDYLFSKENQTTPFSMDSIIILAMFFSIIFGIVAGDSDFARAALYFSICSCVLLPNAISNIKYKKIRYPAIFFVIAFFIVNYYLTELRTGFLGIVPYKFYFQ